MIKVKRFENMPINSNCYLIFNDDSDKCIIIDPGTKDCTNIIPYIKENSLIPEYVIITHEHFDHIWGVNYLKKIYNIKLISNKFTSICITDKKKNLSLFYDQIGFECLKADISFDKEISMMLSNQEFKLICIPGHSEGSICVNIGDFLFTGDTLIKDKKTITKLPGGNLRKLNKSIKKLDKIINSNIMICPGHGKMYRLI